MKVKLRLKNGNYTATVSNNNFTAEYQSRNLRNIFTFIKIKKMNYSICNWEILPRAIQIAKLGGFTISICFDENYRNGFEDYKMIKSICKGWFEDFVEEGDLTIEISKPENYHREGEYYDTIPKIEKIINQAKEWKRPKLVKTRSMTAYMDTAIRKLNFSALIIDKVDKIAAIIAQLDLCKEVELHHIAEAIQYFVNYDEKTFQAEKKSVVFGNMIEIKIGAIPEDAIAEAIDYLTKLKQQTL